LPHSLERGFIERRYRSQHAGRFDPSRRVDNRFENDDPLHARRPGERGIQRHRLDHFYRRFDA
jgi:hypothetical protein